MRLAFLTQLWNSKIDFTDSLMTGEVRNIETTLNVRTSFPSQRIAKLTALCLQSTVSLYDPAIWHANSATLNFVLRTSLPTSKQYSLLMQKVHQGTLNTDMERSNENSKMRK